MSRQLPPNIRRHTNGKGFEVRLSYRDPFTEERKRVSKSAKTLSEAKALLRELNHELHQKGSVATGNQTFGEWADYWVSEILPASDLKESTQRLYANLFRSNIRKSTLWHKKLSQITPIDLNKYFYRELEGLAQQTKRNIYTVISRILVSAVEARLLSSSPLRGSVQRPKRSRKEARFPQRWEIEKIIQRLSSSRYRGALELIAITGLRRGEALGLSWDDIDFNARTLRVSSSLNDEGMRTSPKSARSIRTLDLTDRALEILSRELEIQSLSEARLGKLWKGSEWNPVFTSDDGLPLNPRNFLRVVKRGSKAEGLDEHHLGPITIHSVRHYVATELLNQGVEILVVSRILGHESIQTTVDLYGHLLDNARKRALNLL